VIDVGAMPVVLAVAVVLALLLGLVAVLLAVRAHRGRDDG
jgi:uncharacterized protein involved in exopolysaccharide biosynthesis